MLENVADCGLRFAGECFVLCPKFAGLWNLAAKVFVDHRCGAAGKIAKTVGQIAVVARNERVVAEIAVLAEDDFAQQEIAESIHAEHIRDRARKHDIALGLAHFAGVHQEPAVGPNLSWKREHGGH